MNRLEAQQILLAYRPGTADVNDPEVAEALALAQHDPALARWLEQQRAFHAAMRARFRKIEVPAHLKTSILARQKVPEIILPTPVWRRTPVWLVAAVSVVVLIGIAGVWLKPRLPDRFANFQARMVGQALREYRMDIVTNDMRQVRQFLAGSGAPADYDLTRGLERLRLTGGGRLTWRNNPVAMVCFDRGDNQMLFLFVMKRSALKDPPPETPQLTKVHHLLAASWTKGDKAYLLAGPEESDFAGKYLQATD